MIVVYRKTEDMNEKGEYKWRVNKAEYSICADKLLSSKIDLFGEEEVIRSIANFKLKGYVIVSASPIFYLLELPNEPPPAHRLVT